MTAPALVSTGLQAVLAIVPFFAPPVQPEKHQKFVLASLGLIGIFAIAGGVPLHPAAWPTDPLVFTVVLVAMALVPPFVGLLESRSKGQSVYSTGARPGASNRFPGHLLVNVIGALAAAGLVWVARSTDGFDSFTNDFENEVSFNVMLPLAVIVVFAFVRRQQVAVCADLDQRVKRDDAWEDYITGFSLRHWHQLFNLLYLIAVTFTATTTILYLFVHAMEQAKAGQPLGLSWQVVLAIVVSLSFAFACGLPWSRERRVVYLLFLTGAPAALGAALVWLSWLRADAFRNGFALSIVVVGYVLYCVEAVLGNRRRGEKLELSYFSAAAVAVVLVMLVGVLYLS